MASGTHVEQNPCVSMSSGRDAFVWPGSTCQFYDQQRRKRQAVMYAGMPSIDGVTAMNSNWHSCWGWM